MTWKVELEEQAEKELDNLDPQAARRILRYLFSRIATNEDPRRFGDPLRYEWSGHWRYRIGDFRVICEIQDQALVVLAVRIGHRKNIYD